MEAFKQVLGEKLFSKLDETTLEYIVSIVSDKDSHEDDIVETVYPMLLDALQISGEDEAKEKVVSVLDIIRPKTAKEEEKKILHAPVMIARIAEEQRQAVDAQLRIEMPSEVNVNKELRQTSVVLGSIDASLDDSAQRLKLKNEKREVKREKRETVRQQRYALLRDEIMKRLQTRPVKLHSIVADGGKQRDIKLEGVSMVLGSLELLKDVTITFSEGRKYGLVGKNGIGKTTFLKHLAAHAFEGIPSHLQILHIEQEVEPSDVSVLNTVLNTDIERSALIREERQLQKLLDAADGKIPELSLADAENALQEQGDEFGLIAMNAEERADRLADIFARLTEIEADSAPAQAAAILAGLGFVGDLQDKPTRQFSGGWRMRVALAEALFIQPDILLLDEPTNHLDLHAVLWLEEYLSSWNRTTIIVSHDREFLNGVCTDIVHLYRHTLTRYKGDYDDYEKQRAGLLLTQAKQHDAQEKERAHLQSFVDKNRVRASTAKMAQSRLKKLQKMQDTLVPEVLKDPSFQFTIPQPDTLPDPLVALLDVTFGYTPGKPLYRGVSCNVGMGSRAALVGANGVGKSTLLKLIMHELEPQEGMVRVQPKCKIARFTQHHQDQLDPSKTPLQFFRDQYPDIPPQEFRRHLGSMGITGNLALQPIYSLSGGQKSRVAFAHCTWQKPHLLLLDEPTNHLDMETIDALIMALSTFEGGLLVVSHDAHLISTVCEEIWVCENNRISVFNGDFDDYKRMLQQEQIHQTIQQSTTTAAKHH